MSKFEQSLADGTHHHLKSLEGKYSGIAKTWFEEGKLADESKWEGTLKSILGGRFLLHEYKGFLEGKPIEGLAIYGYSLSDEKFQSAWIDSFHNGTSIMFSENSETRLPFSVIGGYGKSRWQWRTEISKLNDTLTITMYNIPPGGFEEKAVEIIYNKTGDI